MKYLALLFMTLLVCSTLVACASSRPCYESGMQPDSLQSIYVVRRGWHTGIVVATEDWPNQNWALLADFDDVEYIEFGWGDERFYKAEENTFWQGSRAALWPTDSVIHVIGLYDPRSEDALANEIVEVRISAEGLERLAKAIEQEFTDNAPSPSTDTLRAAPAPNRFYEAKRTFFFPRMCNWWTATRLKEAGCPIQPWSVIAASRVMREARGFAERE